MIAYLSGPIENAENDGADWRISITDWLKHNVGHSVFNPVEATQEITKGYKKMTCSCFFAVFRV